MPEIMSRLFFLQELVTSSGSTIEILDKAQAGDIAELRGKADIAAYTFTKAGNLRLLKNSLFDQRGYTKALLSPSYDAAGHMLAGVLAVIHLLYRSTCAVRPLGTQPQRSDMSSIQVYFFRPQSALSVLEVSVLGTLRICGCAALDDQGRSCSRRDSSIWKCDPVVKQRGSLIFLTVSFL